MAYYRETSSSRVSIRGACLHTTAHAVRTPARVRRRSRPRSSVARTCGSSKRKTWAPRRRARRSVVTLYTARRARWPFPGSRPGLCGGFSRKSYPAVNDRLVHNRPPHDTPIRFPTLALRAPPMSNLASAHEFPGIRRRVSRSSSIASEKISSGRTPLVRRPTVLGDRVNFTSRQGLLRGSTPTSRTIPRPDQTPERLYTVEPCSSTWPQSEELEDLRRQPDAATNGRSRVTTLSAAPVRCAGTSSPVASRSSTRAPSAALSNKHIAHHKGRRKNRPGSRFPMGMAVAATAVTLYVGAFGLPHNIVFRTAELEPIHFTRTRMPRSR